MPPVDFIGLKILLLNKGHFRQYRMISIDYLFPSWKLVERLYFELECIVPQSVD